MQISSLKVEAWVSLTLSLSVISLFPSLALKHLLQHRRRPSGSRRRCLRVASNVLNVAVFVFLFLCPDNLKQVLQQLYEGEVRSPSISVSLISFSYRDTNWQTFSFFLCHDSCHCFLQLGCQNCVIGALYSLLPPVKRRLFLNASIGAPVMSRVELDRTEEIKL